MAVARLTRTSLQRAVELWPGLALPLRSAVQRAQHREEPEMELLKWLVPRTGLAVDIGANRGVYTWRLSRIAERVLAVEANPEYIPYLRRIAPSKVEVVNAAVSDRSGRTMLRVPREGAHRGGLGTVEPANLAVSADAEMHPIEARTLDDLTSNRRVSFIKIDVEGHELAVLRGAAKVLESDRPCLLIESEDRHRPLAVQTIFEYLHPLNYVGLMLVGGTLTTTDGFSSEVHQRLVSESDLAAGYRPAGYVNNFIFLPR